MDHHQPSATLEIVPLPTSRTPVKSEPKLLADILRMVMELLLALKLPRKFFFLLRLVSRDFNALITPLLYRHIVLNNRSVLLLVSSVATLPLYKAQVLHNIRRYTQHVTLEGTLPERELESALDSLKYLRLVT